MAKPIEGESAPQYRKKIPCERRPSEVWFSSYNLLNIKENHQSVHLVLQCRHCMCEQRLLESMENSRSHTSHLKSIQYYLVQHVDLQIGNHL